MIGILALQGGYQSHCGLLDQLEVPWRLVRQPDDLNACSGLILPGGESTAMSRLLEAGDLLETMRIFSATHPLLGTCAGLILMGHPGDARVRALGVLDIEIERNAYGRQAQSLTTPLFADLGGAEPVSLQAVFIRAPRITQVGHAVQIHARYLGSPVLVSQGWHLGMTCHPELAGDARIHRYWLEQAGLWGKSERGCELCV